MAKKRNFGNVAEGFFSPQQTPQKIEKEIVPKPIVKTKIQSQIVTNSPKKGELKKTKTIPSQKKIGRPRANDLKLSEEVFKTSIYLTEETAVMIDTYALKKRIDRSEALRNLIRENFKKNKT